MTIGERIRQARKRAGLTQKQLGEVSGTSETTVKQYELGKRQPRIDQLQAIAAALEVEPWELMGYDGSIRVKAPTGSQDNPAESLDSLISTLDKMAKFFPAEEKLKFVFPRLIDTGQDKVADYAMDLMKVPEYRRSDAPSVTPEATDTTPAAPPPESAEDGG